MNMESRLCKWYLPYLFLELWALKPDSVDAATESITRHGESMQANTIRGVWLTNIASNVLHSRENIAAAVSSCTTLGESIFFLREN